MKKTNTAFISKSLIATLIVGCSHLALAQTQTQTPATAKLADNSTSPGSKALRCEDLKQSIDEKLVAKGVKNYQLDIVDLADVTTTSKVIGSCDSGKHRIVYARESVTKN